MSGPDQRLLLVRRRHQEHAVRPRWKLSGPIHCDTPIIRLHRDHWYQFCYPIALTSNENEPTIYQNEQVKKIFMDVQIHSYVTLKSPHFTVSLLDYKHQTIFTVYPH